MNEATTPVKAHALWWYIATWFGSGLSPIVSGTVGSLAALPFAFVIQYTLGNIGLWVASFIIFGVGCWASNQYLKHMGGEDPGEIVVDEVAGQWLLLSAFPMTWEGYLIAFIFFRAFDIAKPWPVCWADQKVEGGVGVMLDDLIAGAFPIAILLLAILLSHIGGRPDLVVPFLEFISGNRV